MAGKVHRLRLAAEGPQRGQHAIPTPCAVPRPVHEQHARERHGRLPYAAPRAWHAHDRRMTDDPIGETARADQSGFLSPWRTSITSATSDVGPSVTW
jgi:hypothetical protein